MATIQKPNAQGDLKVQHFFHYFFYKPTPVYIFMDPSQSTNTWKDIKQTLCNNIQITDCSSAKSNIVINLVSKLVQ